MIRGLTIATCLLAGAYGGYWFFAAHMVKSTTETQIEQLNADGWTINFTDLTTRGFPSRIDTTLTDLVVVPPDAGFVWNAPHFHVFALAYRPNRVIAAWPREQEFTVFDQRLAVTSEDMVASAEVGFSTDVPLDHVTAQAGATTIASDWGWDTGFASLLTALRRGAGDGDTYDIFLQIDDILLPDDLYLALGNGGQQPQTIDNLRIDGTVDLTAPIGRGTAPRLESLELRRAEFTWGAMGLAVSGTLAAGAAGQAEGTLDLTVRNWPLILETAIGAGLVPEGQRMLMSGMLNSLASGDTSFTTQLVMSGGQTRLGPLPIGPAPVLPFTAP